jgi:hypothetical protein
MKARAMERGEAVNEFTRILRGLIAEVSRRVPDDPTLASVRRRVGVVVDLDPELVFGIVGKQLFKRQAMIYARNEYYITDNDLAREVDDSDHERGDLTRYIIPKIRAIWPTLSAADRGGYIDRIVELLDIYVEVQAA